mgnify:CR=1 FL=1
MKKINKKGFTLIELLAVIVVLAVVMLIAVTAVVPMMDRARKQAFITETIVLVEGAESYFLYKEMTGTPLAEEECITLDQIIGQYVDEKGKSDYKGTVRRRKEGTDVIYEISVSDGKNYYIDGERIEYLQNSDENIVHPISEAEDLNPDYDSCD